MQIKRKYTENVLIFEFYQHMFLVPGPQQGAALQRPLPPRPPSVNDLHLKSYSKFIGLIQIQDRNLGIPFPRYIL